MSVTAPERRVRDATGGFQLGLPQLQLVVSSTAPCSWQTQPGSTVDSSAVSSLVHYLEVRCAPEESAGVAHTGDHLAGCDGVARLDVDAVLVHVEAAGAQT